MQDKFVPRLKPDASELLLETLSMGYRSFCFSFIESKSNGNWKNLDKLTFKHLDTLSYSAEGSLKMIYRVSQKKYTDFVDPSNKNIA